MWEFYKKNQSTRHVSRECAKVGIQASASTVRKYVNHGDPRRGIVPFKQRLREIQANTAQVVDTKMVEVAIADIDGWRRLVDQGMTLVAMLMKRAHEKLKPRQKTIRNLDGDKEVIDVPLDAKDLRAAAEAVKVAFGSMKQAAETHDIWSLQSGTDADGRDVWLQEHFEEFTPEEHAAFRDDGIWPERIPLPAWMGGEEPQQQTETSDDPADVLESQDSE
jgi:hypothetical protein